MLCLTLDRSDTTSVVMSSLGHWTRDHMSGTIPVTGYLLTPDMSDGLGRLVYLLRTLSLGGDCLDVDILVEAGLSSDTFLTVV